MLVMAEMAEMAVMQVVVVVMEVMGEIVDLVMEETGEPVDTVELAEGMGEMVVTEHRDEKKAFFSIPIFNFSYSHVDLVC